MSYNVGYDGHPLLIWQCLFKPLCTQPTLTLCNNKRLQEMHNTLVTVVWTWNNNILWRSLDVLTTFKWVLLIDKATFAIVHHVDKHQCNDFISVCVHIIRHNSLSCPWFNTWTTNCTIKVYIIIAKQTLFCSHVKASF